MRLDKILESIWYEKTWTAYLLLPLSWVYLFFIMLRRILYMSGILPISHMSVPVIIVGNVTVGGTGKTPLIIWLCEHLVQNGFKPGIISRGYKGAAHQWPQQVREDSDPYAVGDEPVLLAQRTGCPVVAAPARVKAAQELLQHSQCNILLCDDGLQHAALHRDIEIAVLDGDRRYGNEFCLPAGPLREPLSRLVKIDMLVANNRAERHEYLMEYEYLPIRSLANGEQATLEQFRNQVVHAVAGIGNPGRFISKLRQEGLQIQKHIFPDHHIYAASDLAFADDYPIVMTEKDAVKCRKFNLQNAWYLPIVADPSDSFIHRFDNLIKDKISGQKTS